MIAVVLAAALMQAPPTAAEKYLAQWEAQQDERRGASSAPPPVMSSLPPIAVCNPGISQPVLVAGAAYRACVIKQAGKLERSGESADNVATAALASCDAPKAAFSQALATCGGERLPPATLAIVDPKLKDVAIGVVVRQRAARHR